MEGYVVLVKGQCVVRAVPSEEVPASEWNAGCCRGQSHREGEEPKQIESGLAIMLAVLQDRCGLAARFKARHLRLNGFRGHHVACGRWRSSNSYLRDRSPA